MTKRKLTADDIDMLMQESDFDSSESDHDDSCDDANWDPDPLSSDGSDFDSDESETEAAAMDMDDSVTAASDTNGSSLDQSASEDDDDSNDSTILISGNWTDFVGRQQPFTFSDQSGLLKTLAPNCSPLDVFSLLVDENVIHRIVAETNRYAAQTIANRSLTKFARLNKWVDTDEVEIKKFLSLIFWMGLVRLNSLEKYWSTNPLFQQTVPRATMSRNRFQLLLSMLHSSDNETSESGDRLAKIQPLIDMLQKNFQSLFRPEEDVVIDETLVPWRGRLTFRQYIPNKTHRYGVKLFKLCSMVGYTWALKVYSGKSQTGEREIGLAKNVCIELMKDLIGQGRTLYVDNFYTSYELANYCLQKQTHLVGTLRANKKHIPKEVLQAKLKRGEMVAKEDQQGVVILKWRDTRDVRVLSTKHAPVMKPITQRAPRAASSDAVGQRRRRQRATEKPLAILEYNKGKGGIDLSDQMASYATTLRKGVKWYRKLATELLLGMSVVNAWVVYKEVTKTKIKISKFKELLVEQLLSDAGVVTPSISGSSAPHHHLVERTGALGKKIRQACASCYAKAKQEGGRDGARKNSSKSYTYCDLCPGQPQMCRKCFNELHK